LFHIWFDDLYKNCFPLVARFVPHQNLHFCLIFQTFIHQRNALARCTGAVCTKSSRRWPLRQAEEIAGSAMNCVGMTMAIRTVFTFLEESSRVLRGVFADLQRINFRLQALP
jgi:hypothetical protein